MTLRQPSIIPGPVDESFFTASEKVPLPKSARAKTKGSAPILQIFWISGLGQTWVEVKDEDDFLGVVEQLDAIKDFEGKALVPEAR